MQSQFTWNCKSQKLARNALGCNRRQQEKRSGASQKAMQNIYCTELIFWDVLSLKVVLF